MVSFTEAAKLGVVNCINFTGRSSRSEYWWFILAIILGEIAVGILVGLLPFLSLMVIPVYIFVVLASTSAMFRRVRDAGRSIMTPIVVFVLGLLYVGVMLGGMFDQTMMMIGTGLGLIYLGASIYLLYVLVQPSEEY